VVHKIVMNVAVVHMQVEFLLLRGVQIEIVFIVTCALLVVFWSIVINLMAPPFVFVRLGPLEIPRGNFCCINKGRYLCHLICNYSKSPRPLLALVLVRHSICSSCLHIFCLFDCNQFKGLPIEQVLLVEAWHRSCRNCCYC
jgi:hypothetical protein